MLLTPIMLGLLAGSQNAYAGLAVTGHFMSNMLMVEGKGAVKSSQVSVFNAGNNQLLYSTKANSKGGFLINVPADPKNLCQINVVNGKTKQVFPVGGSSSGCSSAPTCLIKGGDLKLILKKPVINLSSIVTNAPKLSWRISNTGPTLPANNTVIEPTASGSTLEHTFDNPGLYRVDLNGTNSSGSCSDSITVSVAPSAVPKTVKSLAAAAAKSAPKIASTLKAADGSYVVLPFEETGMQGGSQINLPFNPMIPYNSLNAQILKKEAHKPKLRDNTALSIFYSAGVNPKDPAGTGSINSTSQNWFADGTTGSNIDFASTVYDDSSKAPVKNVFLPNHDFVEAAIRKTEQWDRLYQKNRPADQQNSIDNAWQQNRFTPPKPLASLDEGIRGNLDDGAEPRAMPGKNAPYKANTAQPTVYNPDQKAFVAQFVPITNVDDNGRVNPYPVLHVEAKDKSGATVAKADTVYSTASETRCRECHLPGGVAADDNVWRTPISEDELTLPDGPDADTNSDPGLATGAGSYDPGRDATKPWPPAIHNHFDDTHPDKVNFTNLIANSKDLIPRDANNRRTDRVKESRWVKLDDQGQPPVLDVSGNPTDSERVSATRPAQFMAAVEADPANASKTADEKRALADKAAHAAGWTIQFKIKFKSAADYGDANDPILQEKAALFNVLVMHDYMAFYGPTPASGKTVPASYSSQLADSFTEEDTGVSGAKPQYYCSGHHQSQLKFDIGIAAKAAATNRSDYSRAFHAFHGKMQAYKQDVAANESADGKPHKAGELIRDQRGHPLMYGGRGWDSQMDDDNGLPLKQQLDPADSTKLLDPPFTPTAVTKGSDPKTWNSNYFTVPAYDPAKNNWRPDLYPMHGKGKLLLETGDQIAMEDNCVTCHTGKTEKSYRDVHHAAGLKCDSCHGGMLAVGNVYPNEDYDFNLSWAGAFGKDTNNGYGADVIANLLKSEPADFRRPWLDMPDCGSCHVGDGNGGTMSDGMYMPVKGQFSAGVLKQAWAADDATGKSMMPMNARFAVMPSVESRKEKYSILYTQAEIDVIKQSNPASTLKVGDTKETIYSPQPVSQALYRKSGDVHGSGSDGLLTCSTCHGGSHAIWPNPDPNANDNVTAKQLQGYDGNIAECSVCHIKDDFKTGLVATDGGASKMGVAQGVRDGTVIIPNVNTTSQRAYLAGPHGLHPVNDESWWKNAVGIHVDDYQSKLGNGGWHSEMTYKPGPDGEDQCAACHGSDHKGTRLSKTLTARTFKHAETGKPVKVEAGQVIGCDLCHKLETSFKRAPVPTAVDGGWPKAQMHMPPMPEPISPVPAGSGGHGHG